jgi:hypothetical protein
MSALVSVPAPAPGQGHTRQGSFATQLALLSVSGPGSEVAACSAPDNEPSSVVQLCALRTLVVDSTTMVVPLEDEHEGSCAFALEHVRSPASTVSLSWTLERSHGGWGATTATLFAVNLADYQTRFVSGVEADTRLSLRFDSSAEVRRLSHLLFVFQSNIQS